MQTQRTYVHRYGTNLKFISHVAVPLSFLPFLVVGEKGIRHPNFLRKISGECENLIKSFNIYEEYIKTDLYNLKNQPFILFSHTKSCYEGSQT
jgi:hypothetical protein